MDTIDRPILEVHRGRANGHEGAAVLALLS
jgi:hypothetical protein